MDRFDLVTVPATALATVPELAADLEALTATVTALGGTVVGLADALAALSNDVGDLEDALASALASIGGRILGSDDNQSDTALNAAVGPISLAGGGLICPDIAVTARPLVVLWGGPVYHSANGQGPRLVLQQDGVTLDFTAHTSAVNAIQNHWKGIALTPAAGPHTYEVKLGQAIASGVAHAFGSADTPLRLLVLEL